MAKSFYADPETLNALRVLQESRDFNLSSFIKTKLLEESLRKSPSQMNLQYLEYREASIQTQLSDLNTQLEHIQTSIEECKEAKETEIETQATAEKQRLEKEKLRLEAYMSSIKELFIVEESELLELAKEFDINRENFETIYSFMASKGYQPIDFETEAVEILAAKPAKPSVPLIEKDGKLGEQKLSERNKKAIMES
jgi:hypothetical protein